ncbi:MAG: DUF4388 domain-containing protein [Aquihabitans sp.]
MALQGDLQSFALPDVLRLLASTGKTGRLGVTADDSSGDVWLRDGSVVGGAVSSSPYAVDPADVVFELLRFESGAFRFEDGEEPTEPVEPSSVDEAIDQAEGLLREWADVEAIVPSVHSWVTLVPELSGDGTTVSTDQWRALAALGGGSSVRDLGERFEQTDLVASRQVKDLVEAGLVQLGDAPERDEASAYQQSVPTRRDDLAVLRADDGPVVLESRDDALLPEPLPSEGTSFEGDLSDMGSVDARRFETDEADELSDVNDTYDPPAYEPPVYEPPSYAYDPSAQPEPAPQFADDRGYGSGGEVDPIANAFGSGPESRAASEFFRSSDAENSSNLAGEAEDDPLASTPSTESDATAASNEGVDSDTSDESDRGALLNFLSTVKN